MRSPLVVANWKMNTTRAEAQALGRALPPALAGVHGVQVVLCPPSPWLTDVAAAVAGTGIALGAQNMHFQERGAYTGEVSPTMLKGLCDYVLVAQYERRVHFGEMDWAARMKATAALQHGLTPILCVGDSADELDAGASMAVVAEQLENGLEGVPVDGRLVVAYDPRWTTIGMVSPPPTDFVNDMCGHIRDSLAVVFADARPQEVRVIYGGSISVRNVDELAAQPEIDGLLVGAGALSVDTFSSLVARFAAARASA